MTIPATTGKLRTKVSDMQIGDYIPLSWNGSAWMLNTNGQSEIPVTGAAYATTMAQPPSGFIYLVKAAKGLLIGDRVMWNSISWDTLNSWKRIQPGAPWDNGNIIPTMTSNTTPSGIASASSENTSYPAYMAFNGSTAQSNAWLTASSGVTTGWLEYDFPNPTVIRGYAIYPPNSQLTRAPKDWTFEAWDNSQSKWVILDSQKGITSWANDTKKSFYLNNTKSFAKYRINVSANGGDTNFLGIGEMQMMDTAGFIRSLIGGVAYADANGNSSTTNQSNGAWPTNNEWDKFIVNFPTNLIQAGMTLDDVFHWSGVFTWCQDTSMASFGSNTYRALRGKSSVAYLSPAYASTTSNATTGFRPVFQYQE